MAVVAESYGVEDDREVELEELQELVCGGGDPEVAVVGEPSPEACPDDHERLQLLEEVGSVCREIADETVAHEVLAPAGLVPEERLRGAPLGEGGDAAPFVEREVLIQEVGALKAKFDLTLQTLRSILVLESDMGWADILEHVEELASKAQVGAMMRDGVIMDEQEFRREEVRQFEREVEDLEEKVDSQAAFIARLRELLQKQQGLLDMTTDQFERQHERNEQQQQTIASFEAREAYHQETMATQEFRINDLSVHCDGLQAALDDSRALVDRQGAELEAKAARIAELEAELVCRAEQAQLAMEQQQSEAQVEGDRYREDIKYLEELLNKQAEVAERMTEQLQVYEAAERRRYSYRPQARASRENLGEDESVVCSEQNSVGSARPSARGARPPPDGGEQDSGASTASTPLPSSRSYRGQSSTQSYSSKPPSPGSARVPLTSMRAEERIKFLAHFPMASRTERHMRNVIEDRKKIRP